MSLLIKADTARGLGHIQRCLALQEICPETLADWAVLDNYDLTLEDHQAIRATGRKLLVIDDNAHMPHYHADILLNYNAHAAGLKYKTDKTTRLLLGPQYALIRREFRDYPLYRTIPPIARHILVALGSAATDELQALVRSVLAEIECETRWADGQASMPELMAWADLAITAGGVTTYEMAYMGLPMVAIITADNQALSVVALRQKGLAWNLGPAAGLRRQDVRAIVGWAQGDQVLRRVASETGRARVDGKGAERVLEVMLSYGI